MYNVYTINKLKTTFDAIDWDAFLAAAMPDVSTDLNGSSQVVVPEESYLSALNGMLKSDAVSSEVVGKTRLTYGKICIVGTRYNGKENSVITSISVIVGV